jgi:hypothetical protein
MINLGVQKLVKYSAILMLGLSVAGAPALAEKGGNGKGNGGNSGNSSSSNGNGNGNGKSASAAGTEKVKTNNGAAASKYGKLNGFLHASPKALAKASPNSAIGQVAKVYAGLLNSYLAPAEGETAPTVDQVAAALAAATNKPLTADVIAAVNAKLTATNPDLATSLETSGKTPEDLAAEIAAALPI